MKNKLFKPALVFFVSIAFFLTACDKKADNNNIIPAEQEDVGAIASMDLAVSNMITYHDSTYKAKMHSSAHLHRYDSIYHHHDSLYNHHHKKYHHGDTTHHHTGWHHGTTQQHHHDSLNTVHHHSIH
jgi:hypothetical protein